MTDKVQRIREEVERLHNLLPVMDGDNISVNYADRICTTLKMYIDTMQGEQVDYGKLQTSLDDALSKETKESWDKFLQEKPVSIDFEMALAEIINKAQTSVVEPLVIAAQWKDELIKLAKSEEPVSELQVKELAKTQHVNETCQENGNSLTQEPVSEDLEEACEQLAENARKHKAETVSPFFSQTDYRQGVIDGAQWQKEQMMKEAVICVVEPHYKKLIGWYLSLDIVMNEQNYKVGDKVKLAIINED